jgi:hypothetical protein
LGIMCLLKRTKWFKSHIFVWIIWWSQNRTAME